MLAISEIVKQTSISAVSVLVEAVGWRVSERRAVSAGVRVTPTPTPFPAAG